MRRYLYLCPYISSVVEVEEAPYRRSERREDIVKDSMVERGLESPSTSFESSSVPGGQHGCACLSGIYCLSSPRKNLADTDIPRDCSATVTRSKFEILYLSD